MEHDADVVHVFHVDVFAAAILTELHEVTDIFFRRHDRRLNDRFLHVIDLRRIRHIRRVIHTDDFTCGRVNLIDYRRRGRNEVEIELSFKSFLNNFIVKKSQETATETKSQSGRSLRFKRKCRVVELELFERVTEIRILRAIYWIESAEYHLLDRLITGKRLFRRIVRKCDGIARSGISYVFNGRADVTNLTSKKCFRRNELTRMEVSEFCDYELRAGIHHSDLITEFYGAFFDTHVYDNALIRIVLRVEDQGSKRLVLLSARRRQKLDDALEDLIDAGIVLRGNKRRFGSVQADYVFDLLLYFFRLRGRKVDLVDDRQDLEVRVDREISVCQRLRFDALCRVNDQDRAVTGSQASGNFIVKVNVAGRVDEI